MKNIRVYTPTDQYVMQFTWDGNKYVYPQNSGTHLSLQEYQKLVNDINSIVHQRYTVKCRQIQAEDDGGMNGIIMIIIAFLIFGPLGLIIALVCLSGQLGGGESKEQKRARASADTSVALSGYFRQYLSRLVFKLESGRVRRSVQVQPQPAQPHYYQQAAQVQPVYYAPPAPPNQEFHQQPVPVHAHVHAHHQPMPVVVQAPQPVFVQQPPQRVIEGVVRVQSAPPPNDNPNMAQNPNVAFVPILEAPQSFPQEQEQEQEEAVAFGQILLQPPQLEVSSETQPLMNPEIQNV